MLEKKECSTAIPISRFARHCSCKYRVVGAGRHLGHPLQLPVHCTTGTHTTLSYTFINFYCILITGLLLEHVRVYETRSDKQC